MYLSLISYILQKGPVEQDVFSRMLVVKNPKTHDIIRESGFYFFNTTHRRFTGDVLGYITPVSLLVFMAHIYLLLMFILTTMVCLYDMICFMALYMVCLF